MNHGVESSNLGYQMGVQGSEWFRKWFMDCWGKVTAHLSASKPMLSHDIGSLQLYRAGQGAALAGNGPGGPMAGDGQKPRGSLGGERHVSHCGLLSLQVLELSLERDCPWFSKHFSV